MSLPSGFISVHGKFSRESTHCLPGKFSSAHKAGNNSWKLTGTCRRCPCVCVVLGRMGIREEGRPGGRGAEDMASCLKIRRRRRRSVGKGHVLEQKSAEEREGKYERRDDGARVWSETQNRKEWKGRKENRNRRRGMGKIYTRKHVNSLRKM